MTEKISPYDLRAHCIEHMRDSGNCKCCKFYCYEVVTSLFFGEDEQPCFWSDRKLGRIKKNILRVELRDKEP